MAATDERPDSDGGRREVYTLGYTAPEQQRLAQRTAAGSAAFVLPYLPSGTRLLDCGCGPGSITLGLAEAVAPGEVVGVDLEPRQVDAARALAAERGVSNARFEVASVYELPFPDASFDAAVAHTLFLHLGEPLRALAEIRRVLRPGGLVGVSDPDWGAWVVEPSTPGIERFRDLWVRVYEHNGGRPLGARHHRAMLVEAGFGRVEGSASAEFYGGAETTRRVAKGVEVRLGDAAFAGVVNEQGWADRGELDAMLADVRAWSERPDAFFAVLHCAAVGWAPH